MTGRELIEALARNVTFPPGIGSKRFVRDMSDRPPDYVLSERATRFAWRIAYIYRRQLPAEIAKEAVDRKMNHNWVNVATGSKVLLKCSVCGREIWYRGQRGTNDPCPGPPEPKAEKPKKSPKPPPVPEVQDFKWVYVIDHWDIHLKGMCKVNGELLFFRLESDQYPAGPSVYGIYRFPPEEMAYFLQRKSEFEEQVGMHFTYDEGGKSRGPHYVAKPQYADPKGIPLFYSLPKTYDFDEVANRSERVGRYTIPEQGDLFG